ncbi:guanosine-3',5'-bis(diphosphate) 3'-pyrophosphohydrolase MESH1-like [Onthophagus taurus]|uniref:guanosine-3',5'-bis(diphosphate) 3'-pyrophosphohydrolase MESH1-like n=1 Tax=Onthophagus taurus TaxID=166361 RepID=UPI0039BDB7E8
MSTTNFSSNSETSENFHECTHEVVKALVKCATFAAIKHKDQRRKDMAATPYINHPIGVAFILTNEADVTDAAVIQAALLHDTVEDTECTLEEIELNFGSKVMKIVKECTSDKSLPRDVRKQQQIETAPKSSKEAKLVKLAEKLHNVRDLEMRTPRGWTEQRVKQYYSFARNVYNGLKGVNTKLDVLLDELLKRYGA